MTSYDLSPVIATVSQQPDQRHTVWVPVEPPVRRALDKDISGVLATVARRDNALFTERTIEGTRYLACEGTGRNLTPLLTQLQWCLNRRVLAQSEFSLGFRGVSAMDQAMTTLQAQSPSVGVTFTWFRRQGVAHTSYTYAATGPLHGVARVVGEIERAGRLRLPLAVPQGPAAEIA